ncbi:MAG: nitroreductase family deazaflavin-dependent oxidoreductase [Tepidiformaceae bacterium]
MAYLRPNAFQRRIFNKLAIRFGIGDSHALTVRGRKSGSPSTIPVIPVDVDGVRYIVSARGESEWVRNLRAAGEAELARKARPVRFRVTEVPASEASAIIEAYRKKAGATVKSYWKTLPSDADHPVFRLDPQA